MWKIEADEEAEPIKEAPEHARAELKRIRWGTFIGMAISNLVGIAIIMSTAATLHAGGKTEVSRAADVAEALRRQRVDGGLLVCGRKERKRDLRQANCDWDRECRATRCRRRYRACSLVAIGGT